MTCSDSNKNVSRRRRGRCRGPRHRRRSAGRRQPLRAARAEATSSRVPTLKPSGSSSRSRRRSRRSRSRSQRSTRWLWTCLRFCSGCSTIWSGSSVRRSVLPERADERISRLRDLMNQVDTRRRRNTAGSWRPIRSSSSTGEPWTPTRKRSATVGTPNSCAWAGVVEYRTVEGDETGYWDKDQTPGSSTRL